MKRMYVLGKTLTLLWGVLAAPALLHAQTPVGTAFTYQGQLKQAGEPLDDTADFEFSLWNDPSSIDPGDQVGPTVAADNVSVDNGLFTVILDFGASIFAGDARWLEIAVRSPAGGGDFTTLSPRQELTPAPYALYALTGPGSGLYWAATGDDIYNTNAGNVGIGTTSPGSKLDVDGHVRISSGSILSLDGSAVENYLEHVGDGLSTIGTPGLTIRGDEFVSVSCGPGGEVIHIDEYGIVGIGMDNPSSTLDVNGRVESSSGGFRFPDGTTQTTAASGDGHSLDAADGDPVDALYVDNDGNIGIGTPSPSYPLHVEGDGTRIAYVRNTAASGTAVYGENVSVGSFGALGRPYEGVYGESSYAYSGIGVHGKWTGAYPGYGFGGAFTTTSHLAAAVLGQNEATEPGGIGVIGLHQHTSGAGYGVRGETASSDGHGVHGYASATSGANRGVYGQTDSYDGHGGYFENTASGNYGALGGDDYGVQGRGNVAGGFFEDAGGSTYAYVGHSDQGIRAFGAGGGGYFEDISASGYAYVGYGDRGIEAFGSGAGGYFENTASGNYGALGGDEYGVEGYGDAAGGYFHDRDGSGFAYVGRDDFGVQGHGASAGGFFRDSTGSGIAYAGYGDRGIEASGNQAGGFFEDSDESGYAWVGHEDYGIQAHGEGAGGLFIDTNDSGYAYVAGNDFGINAEGNEAGGYFRDANNSGYAYVGYGSFGIEAKGNVAGGFFDDLDSGTWSHVASGTDKINSNGTCNFVQNHPDDPGVVVVYAAPEGDEVATYTRGTARLVNGTARVLLGETFKWVTNPDIGLTAHLTPKGQATLLYVESLTTTEMVVRSAEGFPDDATFDYFVYGLRIGFEEVAVVREKEREAYIPSMADHRALYGRRPELRDYNALERFKRMRAAAGQTQPLDLSASQALRDAIVEFDPAEHSLDDRRELEAPEPIEMGEDRPSEQRPYPPERVEPNDTELAELRDRVETLEALVTRLATSQNGGER